jgi:ferric-dicitrate binding protein FerR (iron transport regulator)
MNAAQNRCSRFVVQLCLYDMSPIPPEDLARITDYVAEELSSVEAAETERWIQGDEVRKALVDYLRRSQQAHRAETLAHADEMAGRFADAFAERLAIGAEGSRVGDVSHARVPSRLRGLGKSSSRQQPLTRWSALVLATGVAGAALVVSMNRASHTDENRAGFAATYRTTSNQHDTVTFADGSRAYLAPNTMLRVAQDYDRDERLVALDGHAYFEVERSTGAPFIVRTNTVRTRVLGTAFSITNDAPSHVIRVAVTAGRVQVATTTRPTAPTTVSAGAILLIADSSTSSGRLTGTDSYVDWKNGRLVFRDAPVPDLLRVVGGWYGYDLRVTDSVLARQHVTATFDRLPVSDALTAVKALLGVTMTFEGRIITLRPSGTVDAPAAKKGQEIHRKITSPRNEVGR